MADYDLQFQDTYIDALLATANELKTAGYIYKGVATPSTNPGTPTERVAYLASEPGTYTNFGGIVIASGLYSLTYASGTWTGTQMSAGSDIEVVQTTGGSTTDVMSQKAVTDEIGKCALVKDSDSTADLDISDENGYVLARFAEGHFQTKNFNSKNVGVGVEDYPENDFGISDGNGNVIVRFKGGHVQTKKFNSESITTDILQYRKVGLIRHTSFNSITLPNGWSNEGNLFTLTANGAQTPSNGSISTMLEYQQYSDLDSDVVTFRITMNAASKFYLTRYNLKYASTLGGQVVMFDFINKKVVVYAETKKGVTPSTILAQYTIPFDFVAGDYSISLWRWAEIKRFIIQGGGQTAHFEYNSASIATSDGRAYDKYGITFIEGNFIVKSASFSSQMAAEPDLLIVGDSVTNGDTIRTSQGGTYKNRYASLVSEKTLCSICALGGNNSNDIARNNAMYLDIFKPKKVLYAIGLNDTNASTWQTNAEAFISSWEAKGAEVILSTWWAKSGNETASATITNYVKNSGHRYVDFRGAMTVDGLGVTLKSGLFLSDALHPNPAGHALMAKTLENDISDIINL